MAPRLGFLRPTKNVIFVYDDELRYAGSTVMRGEQLSKIAKLALGGSTNVYYLSSKNEFKRSTLFLTKWALKKISHESLARLKKKGNKLIFDPVDSAIDTEQVRYADVIVAASRTAFEDYQKEFPLKRIALVDHHVDPRLKQLDWSNRPTKFSAGYFGETVNTIASGNINKMVDFFQVDTSKQTNDWLEHLPDYSMHYAIRQIRKNDNHKPFLKGFTAAFCGANILIQDTQKEALLWLGKDYPYLLHGEVDEKTIIGALERAKEGYGSDKWTRGLDVMRDIKEQTTDSIIGKQFADLIAGI
jgi:hypothetical protein